MERTLRDILQSQSYDRDVFFSKVSHPLRHEFYHIIIQHANDILTDPSISHLLDDIFTINSNNRTGMIATANSDNFPVLIPVDENGAYYSNIIL